MKQMKFAIAGLGSATTKIHLPAYKGLRNIEVVGGFDPVVSKGPFRFPLFTSAEEMLEKTRPDVLAVVTPPDSHFALTQLGLQAGCHVFCEKPFMPTMEEALKVVLLSQKVGRKIVVNNQYRFMNIHSAARKQIGSAEFGDLLFLSAVQTFNMTAHTEAGWRGTDPRRTCKEFGTHVLDLCRYFFAEDPESVTALMPKPKQPNGPDYLNLIELRFSGDRIAQITLDRLWRGRTKYLSIRLDGSAGGIMTHIGGRLEMRAGIGGGVRLPYIKLDIALGGKADLFHGERSRRIARDPLDLFASATRRLVQDWLSSMENGSPIPCTGEDNIRTLALMLACYESAGRRETITMDYSRFPF